MGKGYSQGNLQGYPNRATIRASPGLPPGYGPGYPRELPPVLSRGLGHPGPRPGPPYASSTLSGSSLLQQDIALAAALNSKPYVTTNPFDLFVYNLRLMQSRKYSQYSNFDLLWFLLVLFIKDATTYCRYLIFVAFSWHKNIILDHYIAQLHIFLTNLENKPENSGEFKAQVNCGNSRLNSKWCNVKRQDYLLHDSNYLV